MNGVIEKRKREKRDGGEKKLDGGSKKRKRKHL